VIRTSVRRPVAVAMAYCALALLGVLAWTNIPIELLPDTRLPRLTITASWPGASPETTEAFLTAPLEGAIQQVRGIERITSTSDEQWGAGRARITVEFQRGVDMDFARLELTERMNALDDEVPPAASRPRITPYVPQEFRDQTGPFMSFTVTGPHTLEALRAHVDEVLEPELVQLDGVAALDVSGGRNRLLEIEVDEGRMLAHGLRPDDVFRRVADLEIVREIGSVREAGRIYSVALRERAESADALRSLVLRSDDGLPVRLSDVGTVRDTYEDHRSHYRIDGEPAVSFNVIREIGSNAVAVADRVHARLAELERAHPAGVRVIADRDESEAIRAQLTDLRTRAIAAAVVIFVVLLVFLRSFRSAAIVFLTIAFSILIALNLIYFGGLSLNVLTLMGLAMGFGLIVDNAIVVLENVYRRRRAGEDAAAAAEGGTREVVLPILAATLTTLVVLVPFVYLQGELQIYYVPLAIAVGLSLLASLFVAFTFIPALASKVLRRRMRREPGVMGGMGGMGGMGDAGGGGDALAAGGAVASREPRAASGETPAWYVRLYAAMTGTTLRFPWVTVILAALILGGSWYLFDENVNRGVVWRAWGQDRTHIDIQIRLPRGQELERTDELARHFEDRLRQMPEVSRFVSNVQPTYAHIRVDFPEELEATAIPLVTHEQMVAYSHRFGGADVRIFGRGQAFYGGGSAPPNYSIRILGYNYERVREIAEDLGRRLERFSRIQEVDTNASGQRFVRDRATELVLRVDRDRLAMHDVTMRDVVRQVNAAVAGPDRQSLVRLGGEEYRLGVRLAGHYGMDDGDLLNLFVPTRTGNGLRLGDVATIDERQVLTEILRENQQYQRVVAYEFRGPRRLGDAVQEAVLEVTEVPPGYEIVARQEWTWSTEEQRQIWGVLLIALLLVFMATAALFESFRQPFCVLLTVPMALVGVFLIFVVTEASFTREAYIGVIMMAGVVVNNAILLVDHINRLRREYLVPFRDAILRGTLERVRPILMTSATTIFGLLPLVLFSEYADQNIWNALGYALIGGLASSTIFVLTVTPALYLLLERGPEGRRVG
jgi:hydrophobic/amphiphilic exporter-1 (mainly G- bacteria), HAE1 family